jgi:hypothetical protein
MVPVKPRRCRILVDLHPRHLRLTEAGFEQVGEVLHRYKADAWYGPGCVFVKRIGAGDGDALRAELEAVVDRAAIPTVPGW